MPVYFLPEHIRIDFTIKADAGLLALLNKIVDQNEVVPKLPALTARLGAANQTLAAIVAAHPDPDSTD